MAQNKKVKISKREEERANRIVQIIFLVLFLIAVATMIGYAVFFG